MYLNTKYLTAAKPCIYVYTELSSILVYEYLDSYLKTFPFYQCICKLLDYICI